MKETINISIEQIQFLVLIPLVLGALYVAVRVTCAGVGIHRLFSVPPRFIACIVLTVQGSICLGYMFLSHLEIQSGNASVNRVMAWVSGVYLAFFMYYLIILTATDILRIFLRCFAHRETPAGFFIIFSFGIAVMLTTAGVMHARDVKTASYELSSGGRLSSPLRIVEVSDLHMGSVIGTAHVQQVVDAVNAQHPDIVVFLGDQFNRTSAIDITDEEAMFKTLSCIEAPLGVYAVLGNHDPELSTDIYQQYLSESGIIALDNDVLEIPGSGLLMVGRTKLAGDAERVPLAELLDGAGRAEDITESAGNDLSDSYMLVLDHDPGGIAEAVSCDADLVLAGHTHGGQFFPVTLITRFSYGKGYDYGLAKTSNEITGHVTTSIVSSGAGYFQTPIRVGTDTEIVCVDIK